MRLSGIDAPEKKQPFGKKSKSNLLKLIANKFVEVEYKKRDRYKRVLGKILLDGVDVNLMQVKQGFAWHYKYYQRNQSKRDRALYSLAESIAKRKKTELWSDTALPTAPWDFRRRLKKTEIGVLKRVLYLLANQTHFLPLIIICFI